MHQAWLPYSSPPVRMVKLCEAMEAAGDEDRNLLSLRFTGVVLTFRLIDVDVDVVPQLVSYVADEYADLLVSSSLFLTILLFTSYFV